MTDPICPHCGGAISVKLAANPQRQLAQIPTPSTANPDANGEVARKVLILDQAVTKDGRQAYNQGYPESFEVFWKLYPKRKSKRKALIAWRNSVRRAGANPADAMAQINAGAIRYRDDPNRPAQFTQDGATWLNADGWLDDPLPARIGGAPQATPVESTRVSHVYGSEECPECGVVHGAMTK